MITKLKALWMQTFGDSRESVDAFFATAYSPEHSAVIFLENQPVSALYWLDYAWKGKKLAYIYAVATDEKYRGQGYGTKLMKKAHGALRELGYAGAVLVPAEKRLVFWYETLGYQTCYRAKKQEIFAKKAIPVTEITAAEYAEKREKMLPDVPQPGKALYDFFATYGSFYQAENCIFAASRQDDKVQFQEFLGDGQKLPGIIGGMNAKSGVVFLPDNETTFAMFYPLTETKAPTYFSFALD